MFIGSLMCVFLLLLLNLVSFGIVMTAGKRRYDVCKKDLLQTKKELNAMFYKALDITHGDYIGMNRKQAAQAILDAFEKAARER